MQLELRLDEDRTAYQPGGRLRGEASWETQGDCDELEVRLVWQTRGIGSLDTAVAAREVITRPRSVGRQAFSLHLPWEPYSFSGKLVSVEWRVEFGNPRSDDWTFLPITLSGDGREVDLPDLSDDDE